MENRPLYRHDKLCMGLTKASGILLLASIAALVFSQSDLSRLLIVGLFVVYGVRDTLWMDHKYGIPIGLLQLTAAASLLLTVSVVFPYVPNNMGHIFWCIFAVLILVAIYLRGVVHREFMSED